ncbi:thioredoxin [Thiospirochaeta perfilievii]|uniref:Thioredoxin n=1 Tax=Thiospirochaeta perfilievii TaxID=252967 RepID=A0A5C1QDA4_9SPIO|nr:thioredoxin family protein [Thiospirochaeta perfilievii]QEN04182.1 thioredoxin [Thiospirochaeta perfilievii]
MTELFNKEELDGAIKENQFVLVYLSKTNCGVCKALKPKIKMIADKYPNLNQYYINLDNDETIIGQYSLFTIPGLLVFVEGRESIREARYMSMDDIDSRIGRISKMLES